MGRTGHGIRDVSVDERSGTCTVCGPVRIYVQTPGKYTCANRAKASAAAWEARNGARKAARKRALRAEKIAAGIIIPKQKQPPVEERLRYYRTNDGKTAFFMRLGEIQALKDGAVCSACLSTEDLNIDHCHETGRFRGLLCGPCNRALGLLKDNVDTLSRLISYLQS